jgi:hypothetical protein
MSYRKFHLFLDLFGILGVGLAISYYLVSHQVPEQNKDQELFNLWGNFSTEIIGIWIGVRLIDYVIQQNEKKHFSRIKIVRNMRFLISTARSSIDFSNRPAIAKLNYEINWSNKVFSSRQIFLSQDKINDVEDFYLALINFFQELKNYLIYKKNLVLMRKLEKTWRKSEKICGLYWNEWKRFVKKLKLTFLRRLKKNKLCKYIVFSLGFAIARPNLQFTYYLTIDPKSANTRA